MGFITKLQAINQMLLTAGESLVADLNNNSGIDTGIAETILEQASLDMQMRGLANNKLVRKFNPDSSGKIIFDSADSDEEGIISAELISWHLNTDGIQITAKLFSDSPPRLYNYTDETDIWISGDYYVEVIKKLRPLTKKIFDVHLMISPVDNFIRDFADAGADIITFHPEATSNISNTIRLIKEAKKINAKIHLFGHAKNSNTFISKEHPAFEYYPGIKDSRDWMFPNTEGYYPSFFSFWKKGTSAKGKI